MKLSKKRPDRPRTKFVSPFPGGHSTYAPHAWIAWPLPLWPPADALEIKGPSKRPSWRAEADEGGEGETLTHPQQQPEFIPLYLCDAVMKLFYPDFNRRRNRARPTTTTTTATS